MRFLPALVAVLLPLASVAQTDEWVRDDMSDESLWLLRTANLAREAPRSVSLPGAPDGASHWVMSRGDGPAYVVYFIPGRIHEVEIDTHRLAGAEGDFTLAVSTDGKLYQPLDAGAVLLDTSFGWDYRLMASDQIPDNATHLLVQFPDGSTAHGLSEVWIRYTWDDSLVSRFLPPPAPVGEPAPAAPAAQSDAELQAMLEQLITQSATQPAREIPPLVNEPPVEPPLPVGLVAEPFRIPHSIDTTATAQFEPPGVAGIVAAPVVIEHEPAEPRESTEPDVAPIDEKAPATASDRNIESLIEPDAELATDPAETSDAIDSNVSEATTIDVTAFDTPEVTGVDTLTPDLIPETGVAADGPAEESILVEIPPIPAVDRPLEITPDRIDVAEPRVEDATEEAIVLPTFTLPVFVGSEPDEPAEEPRFESMPQPTANSVVIETLDTATDKPYPAPEQAAPTVEEVRVPAYTPSPAESDTGDPKEQQSPPSVDSLARIEAAETERPMSLDADDEPESRPTLRLKRSGPRSKSRGTYVQRG